MKKVVDVFIEDNCPACENVLSVVQSSLDGGADLNVYERRLHPEMFRSRSVHICPATFVNRRLVFYGEFSRAEFLRQMG